VKATLKCTTAKVPVLARLSESGIRMAVYSKDPFNALMVSILTAARIELC